MDDIARKSLEKKKVRYLRCRKLERYNDIEAIDIIRVNNEWSIQK
jgi:hypothetical protein